MSMDVEKWLSHLPIAEEHIGEGILLNVEFMPSAPGEARILVGELCLTFLREDILDIEPAAELENLPPPHLHLIRIVVRKGAPLLDARAKDLCGTAAPGRRPFALSTRPSIITHDPSPRFRDLEHQFLQRQSLIDA
jgi:hypothetical protein